MQEVPGEKWFAIWGGVAEFHLLKLIKVEKWIPDGLIRLQFQPEIMLERKEKRREKLKKGGGEEGQEGERKVECHRELWLLSVLSVAGPRSPPPRNAGRGVANLKCLPSLFPVLVPELLRCLCCLGKCSGRASPVSYSDVNFRGWSTRLCWWAAFRKPDSAAALPVTSMHKERGKLANYGREIDTLKLLESLFHFLRIHVTKSEFHLKMFQSLPWKLKTFQISIQFFISSLFFFSVETYFLTKLLFVLVCCCCCFLVVSSIYVIDHLSILTMAALKSLSHNPDIISLFPPIYWLSFVWDLSGRWHDLWFSIKA